MQLSPDWTLEVSDETVLVYVGDEWCDLFELYGHVVSRAVWDEYEAAVAKVEELREQMRRGPVVDERPYVEPGPNSIDLSDYTVLVPPTSPIRNLPLPRLPR